MTRIDIINHLVRLYNYSTYLEIGTHDGQCFRRVDAEQKICVDPERRYDGLTHHMTSDEFFQKNVATFDIIFVDGLHLEEQSTKDVMNSLQVLNEGGSIIIHDCLPHCEEFTQVQWNGTVFRTLVELRCTRPDLSVTVVDTDCGCGILQRGKQEAYTATSPEIAKTYNYYAQHKKELMNVISVEEFMRLYS